MAIHHIIPRHEWKARFGNLIGFNVTENLVDLYTEQHAQVHQHYFNEITHIEYDRIAGLAITKQIGKEEANKKAVSFAQKGKKKSKAHCLALSIAHKGQKSSLGFKHTMESRKNMSLAHRSKRTPRTEATKAKISATKMGHFVSEETKKKISNTKKAKYHDSRCKKTFY